MQELPLPELSSSVSTKQRLFIRVAAYQVTPNQQLTNESSKC